MSLLQNAPSLSRVQSRSTTGSGRANKIKGTSLALPIHANASAHWLASRYTCTTHRLGNFFKGRLQLVSKGSSERLELEFCIRWTIAKASSSTIRLGIFSAATRFSLSRRAHSSASTLFSCPPNWVCFFDKEISSPFSFFLFILYFYFFNLLESERQIPWTRIMFILFTSLGVHASHMLLLEWAT